MPLYYGFSFSILTQVYVESNLIIHLVFFASENDGFHGKVISIFFTIKT